MGPVIQSPHPHYLHLALVAVIAGTALVGLRERERNMLEIKMKILNFFFNVDQRRFPFSSGILKDIQSHAELEF